METVEIAGTGIKASRLGLGTWAIGGWMWNGTDEKESIKTIHAALNKGINLIDTAPVYGLGLSEKIVGDALRQYGGREKIILATKVGLQWNKKGKVWRNSTREDIYREIEDSLERLQTDYIDVYQVHWPDPLVPFEETARALEEVYKQGKILSIGVSNYSPQQMDAFREAAPLHVCQPPHNLFERQMEKDILPYCKKHNITLITYSGLCRGILTGKIDENTEFHGDDLRKIDPKYKGKRFEQYLEAVRKLDHYVKEKYNKRIIHLAFRWLLDQNDISIALWGARRPEQMEPVEEIFGWKLTDEDMKEIDNILNETITDPAGPGYMAPPTRDEI
jgi:aryl-alcohol dehydrogenase-like predicted oxidoreductase